MCALRSGLKGPKYSQCSAGKWFEYACDVHWKSHKLRILWLKTTRLDLFFAHSDRKQAFRSCVALVFEENFPRCGGPFLSFKCGICNIFQQMLNGIYARPSLPADFRKVPREPKYLWMLAALFQRPARSELKYLIPPECIKVCLFTKSKTSSRCALLLVRWALIQVLMGVPLYYHHASRIRKMSSWWREQWALGTCVYGLGRVILSSPLRHANNYQRLRFLFSVLSKITSVLEFFVFLWIQPSAAWVQHLVFII